MERTSYQKLIDHTFTQAGFQKESLGGGNVAYTRYIGDFCIVAGYGGSLDWAEKESGDIGFDVLYRDDYQFSHTSRTVLRLLEDIDLVIKGIQIALDVAAASS